MWRPGPIGTGSGSSNESCTGEVRKSGLGPTASLRGPSWRAGCITKGACPVREGGTQKPTDESRQGAGRPPHATRCLLRHLSQYRCANPFYGIPQSRPPPNGTIPVRVSMYSGEWNVDDPGASTRLKRAPDAPQTERARPYEGTTTFTVGRAVATRDFILRSSVHRAALDSRARAT